MTIRKLFSILILLFLLDGAFNFSFAQGNIGLRQEAENYPIIPKPSKLTPKEGSFLINSETLIYLDHNSPELSNTTELLNDIVEKAIGERLNYSKKAITNNTISFVIDNSILNKEGYKLSVSPNGIMVKSKTLNGAFLAIQSLRQIMPAEIGLKKDSVKNFSIPSVEIEDSPRFSYRGIMLDVARHYKSIDFIEKYIDVLSFYKFNTLHLHLNDDQGWRIEIKKYPKLQKISAWREETLIGNYWDETEEYDGKPHGGYYTQKELKELVKYAERKNITIIPEIEMPGHSRAVLAAYPELGCEPGATYEVATTWGVFNEIYCPKKETFVFLENVLDEVISIFPSKYIHIGGDEAPKEQWEKSEIAQNLIKKHNLGDEDGLQSYFIRRIEKYLNSKGRFIIGWDEILEGGLSPNATVMSWRGEKGGIVAAKQKHNVIMTPNTHLYFDFYQTKGIDHKEPNANGKFPITLEKVYSYDPIPQALDKDEEKYILGVQANLWSEYITTNEHAELMTFPRAIALAEVAWSLNKDSFKEFSNRLTRNLKFLNSMNVNYADYFQD